MTKLKTLKELINTNCCTVCATMLKGDLKKEAIKEIKFAKTKDGTKGLFENGIAVMFTKDVIEYIKWKNNITDEDLK